MRMLSYLFRPKAGLMACVGFCKLVLRRVIYDCYGVFEGCYRVNAFIALGGFAGISAVDGVLMGLM